MMASACAYTGATWGVSVEPIDPCIPQCTWCVMYRASVMDLIVSSMNIWVMHPSSLKLVQPCLDNLAFMAFISINSIFNTTYIYFLFNIY